MAFALLAGAASACGGDLPHPPYVGQNTADLVVVPYSPPPARAEYVPEKTVSGSVWIDGEWIWQGSRYAWRKGRWVRPPAGARFSPWTAVRGDDGAMYDAPGVWRDANNRPVGDPPAIAYARSTVGELVNPEGQSEAVGRNIRDVGRAPASDGGPSDSGAVAPANAALPGDAGAALD